MGKNSSRVNILTKSNCRINRVRVIRVEPVRVQVRVRVDVNSGGSKGGASLAPPGSKFFQFHAVFGKFWQNRMLAPPTPVGWRPHLGEILDPPLVNVMNVEQNK